MQIHQYFCKQCRSRSKGCSFLHYIRSALITMDLKNNNNTTLIILKESYQEFIPLNMTIGLLQFLLLLDMKLISFVLYIWQSRPRKYRMSGDLPQVQATNNAKISGSENKHNFLIPSPVPTRRNRTYSAWVPHSMMMK